MLINSYHCPSGARPEKKKKSFITNFFINNEHIQNKKKTTKNTAFALPSFSIVLMHFPPNESLR